MTALRRKILQQDLARLQVDLLEVLLQWRLGLVSRDLQQEEALADCKVLLSVLVDQVSAGFLQWEVLVSSG